MLERTSVLVDTSYLLASFYNSWETGARAQLSIDLSEVVHILGSMIKRQLHQPIHRQYWYDGIPDSGPHRYQRALRTCDGVILRTGQLIEWGDRRTQKAVDTRLVADMVLTAVHQTVSDIVLVSGDADMIPGVEEATNAGIRVHLYGFGWDSMSSALRHVCDSTTILDPREDFAETMQIQVLEGPLPPAPRIKPHKTEEESQPEEEVGTTPPSEEKETGTPHTTSEDNAANTPANAKPEPQGDSDAPATESSDATAAHTGCAESLAAPETKDDAAQSDPESSSPAGSSDASRGTIPEDIPCPNVAQDAAQAAAKAASTPAGSTSAENFEVDQAERAANRISAPKGAASGYATQVDEHGEPAPLRPDTRSPNTAAPSLIQPDASSTPPAVDTAGAQPRAHNSANSGAEGTQNTVDVTPSQPATPTQLQAGHHSDNHSGAVSPGELAERRFGHYVSMSTSEEEQNASPFAAHFQAPGVKEAIVKGEEQTSAPEQAQTDEGSQAVTAEPSQPTAPSNPPAQAQEKAQTPATKKSTQRPKPSMMAPRRKLRSRYVPLPNEVWASAGEQTPFDVGQQYATWWFDHAATQEQRDQAHLLSGGGLPPEVDRPLLQFACETLHEYTLSQAERVDLRDGFHSGIRGVLISFSRNK